MEFHELIDGVWVVPSAGGHNSGVIVGERAVLLIDPGSSELDGRAIRGFIKENAPGRDVWMALFTGEVKVEANGWPEAHVLDPREPRNGVSLPDLIPGWESVALGEASSPRFGLYNRALRVLFCGDMLVDPQVGIPRLSGDSQGYLDALDQVEGLDLKLVVPLRGAPASGKRAIRSRIEGDRSYVLSLLRHVVTTQSANVPLDRALSVASDIYETFPHLKEHLANLRSVWGELA
jgi:glyoxylase-like metal-dependent hydrolase (beta-lactamase superfamily II)